MTQDKTQNYKHFHDAAESKKPFQVYSLTKQDIANFLTLQAETKGRQNGHHLKERSNNEIKEQLDGGNIILGVHDKDGNHVAQCVLADPKLNVTQNIQAFEGETDYAVIQSVAFKNGFRPKQLNGWNYKEKPDFLLLEETKVIAEENGIKHIFAKVNPENKGSIDLFERAGFTKSIPRQVGDNNYQSCVMSFNVAVISHAHPIAESYIEVVKYTKSVPALL